MNMISLHYHPILWTYLSTIKILNIWTPQKFAVITLKFEQNSFTEEDAARIANSVDPDQTAPVGAVWSGSALFAQTYLSENLGSLRYP